MKSFCLTPREIEDRLIAAGVRPTAQRIAIAQYVLCEAKHPTADDVKKWSDKNFPKLSMATVYNTLSALVKAGLLREFRLSHSASVVYDHNIEAHHHFLDEKTGKLYDLPAHEVEVSIKPGKHAKVREVEVLLRGEWAG
jgi:Fur family iron response transcriptional regulator